MNSTRNFIQGCSALFIWLGGISFCIAVVAGVATAASGMAFFAVVPVLVGIIGAASVVLIGGGTYVLCSIDRRLEELNLQ